MKRKLIICSSLITLLLACFSVPIYAEETTHDDAGSTPISSSLQLDSYFYQNYDLLPYIEANQNQYINTGIKASSELKISLRASDFNDSSTACLFGSRVAYQQEALYLVYISNFNGGGQTGNFNFNVGSTFLRSPDMNTPYVMHNIVADKSDLYIDGVRNVHIEYGAFTSNLDMYIFALNGNGSAIQYSKYKLYQFSIYDYSANNGEGDYVRNYYPAKSKASGTIGLYDTISKTFSVSSSNTQFSSPVDDQVLDLQIGSFITNSLTWIGQILTAIIQIPIIIVFMAIGLAGAMFRWSRRIVHF